MRSNTANAKRKVLRSAFAEGARDGFPIGLGYFAVAFSLGIAAKNAGLSAIEGLVASLLNNASAGEYIGFTLIAASASYTEVALMTFITNARYLLMSCALSQKFSPETSLIHRILIGFDVTDELFGINIARPGFIDPKYSYGAMSATVPLWAAGTFFGVIMGNVLPVRIVSALSVALYGMFLAVIIPPSRKHRRVAAAVAVSFALSFAAERLPVLAGISSGTKTIILTVVIASVFAVVSPIVDHEEAEHDE